MIFRISEQKDIILARAIYRPRDGIRLEQTIFAAFSSIVL